MVPATISSLQNPHVRSAVRLRQRSHRMKQGRIVIDGVREIHRALDAGIELDEVFVCEKMCGDAAAELIVRTQSVAGSQHSTRQWTVTRPVMSKLAFGDRSEGVVATAKTPERALERVDLPDSPLVAVLEGVEKPGNVGAVFRSADAARISAVVLADPVVDLYNPNSIRASLGTVFTVPAAIASSHHVIDWLHHHHLGIVVARPDAAVSYTDVDFKAATAIVLGSEAVGLSEKWTFPDATSVRLPMLGRADSLNVSTAAAVLFYEARRQRDAAC